MVVCAGPRPTGRPDVRRGAGRGVRARDGRGGEGRRREDDGCPALHRAGRCPIGRPRTSVGDARDPDGGSRMEARRHCGVLEGFRAGSGLRDRPDWTDARTRTRGRRGWNHRRDARRKSRPARCRRTGQSRTGRRRATLVAQWRLRPCPRPGSAGRLRSARLRRPRSPARRRALPAAAILRRCRTADHRRGDRPKGRPRRGVHRAG